MGMAESGLVPTPAERKQVNVLFQLDNSWHRKAKIDGFRRGKTFREWMTAALKARVDEQELTT